MAWAAITTSVRKGFLRTSVKDVALQFHASRLVKVLMVTGERKNSLMKKFFFSMLLLLFSVATVRAQQDVVRFLDIPVDGSKAAMVAKLKAKGFKSSLVGDLEGQFNGRKVWLSIVTNKDKVYRIVVQDAVSLDEGEIRIRFNQLCNQFGKNSKYVGDADAYKIPEGEDISFQMTVKGKRYEAVFW